MTYEIFVLVYTMMQNAINNNSWDREQIIKVYTLVIENKEIEWNVHMIQKLYKFATFNFFNGTSSTA